MKNDILDIVNKHIAEHKESNTINALQSLYKEIDSLNFPDENKEVIRVKLKNGFNLEYDLVFYMKEIKRTTYSVKLTDGRAYYCLSSFCGSKPMEIKYKIASPYRNFLLRLIKNCIDDKVMFESKIKEFLEGTNHSLMEIVYTE